MREFWQRWHISLSTWLWDYLYIPLGGNRGVGRWLTYKNLLVTMLLGGLWHGAAWTFVAWGALHGLVLAITNFVRDVRDRKAPSADRAWRPRHLLPAALTFNGRAHFPRTEPELAPRSSVRGRNARSRDSGRPWGARTLRLRRSAVASAGRRGTRRRRGDLPGCRLHCRALHLLPILIRQVGLTGERIPSHWPGQSRSFDLGCLAVSSP